MRHLFAAAAIGLLGCTIGPSDQLAELNRARDRWSEQHIPAYALTLRRGCFCAGPQVVEVRVDENTIVRIDIETGDPIPSYAAPFFPDVAGLFQIIADEITRPAASIVVQYHPDLGYPTSISVDVVKNAIDDEYGYTITGFRIAR